MSAQIVTPANKAASREIQAGLRILIRGIRKLSFEIEKQAASKSSQSRRHVSPGRRLHGRYIGLIRNLPAQQKAKVRAVRAKQGVAAAIKMAREMRKAA